MIPESEISKVRKILEECKDPIFIFDDDCDGLSSYLVLKKHYRKGIFIISKKGSKGLSDYLPKINSYNPDLIVLLDIPITDQEFIDQCPCKVVWIDHHPPLELNNVFYFNPRKYDPKKNIPTSSLAYLIVKDQLWLAATGTVADWVIPSFKDRFNKEYPGYYGQIKNEGQGLFDTKLGKLSQILWFVIKGKTADIKRAVHYLEKVEHPDEIFNKKEGAGKWVYNYSKKFIDEYEEILEDAKKSASDEKFLIYNYPFNAKNSYSSYLSNQLLYLFPKKVTIIAREKNDNVRLSIRASKEYNKPVEPALKKALVGINGYGGGHDYACGGSILKEDFERFLKNFKEEME